ncbi:uncharacterized protein LOC125664362 isoform X7 [Ostrea edulis]|uniref:uncharacterized protein LOC125664362 isoform X7 n=1 Tax=Ostrea edulis TaxID=37623 RepID=UPI0024AEB250|nr:uncharacterized protein LOC125664362 isoform X7 [Ostrea edulis]
MSEIVKYCPTNLTEIIAASARLNCGEDRFGNDQYLCLPNVRKTGLVEYCHEGVIPLIPSGYCVDTTGGQLYSRICEQFLYGCPSQHFQTNKIYRYPACLNINTESRCYFADPSCPNTTSTFTTEDMMETSSTYSNFSNTTVNTLYTTTTSLEDVTDVGAVVGGVLAAVFVITVLLILVCVVLRRRKQRKNQPSDGRDAETPLFESTNETGNRTEKNSNSPTDSHEPDNNDSVHDEGRDAETPLLGRDAETPLLESTNETGNEIEERSNYPADSHEPDNKNSVPDEVKNQIKRRGIDFLLSMSTEHGEYHNGIAQLLNVPVEVLGMGKEEIETFVRNYKKGSTKVYCGRGMVVGCFGAGKTTLVKKLKGEDVSLPPESTRGLEVHTDIFTVNQNETVLADYINHWLGSIHTYSSKTAPVILVQSHSEKKEKKEKEDYFLKVLQDVTDTLHVHLSTDKVFAVEKDSDENIEEIKSSMLKIVKNQNHWGESIPTSWVHLEAYLMEIKKQQMVLQKKDLWETLAFQSSQPDLQLTSKEDMTTALRFFNDIGVILFTTSSESIILDVQWFVDAFKHIITDESHAKHDITKHFTDWRKFNANGILPKNLVKEIWRGSESLTRYTEDLIFHLIRLGMIAEIEKGEKYYVPCMNKQKYNTKVLNKCACSYIVCFTFQYLPLVIYHRLVATCMTEEGWRIWDGNDQKETANTSKCVFHTAAILQGKDDLKILIGITENKHNLYDEKHENRYPYSIEIQGFVLENQTMQPQFARSKLKRIREHLKDLTSCFGANRDRAFKIGYRCSITPFSDTPDSHIILLSEKECTTCRKSVNVDDMRSFWMDDARSENDIFHIDEEKQERKNKDEDNETQLKIQHADNVSIFESNNKTRNRRVENGNFPADSHEPDNNDSVHNEGNEGDTTSLQPLTDVQQDNDSGGYRPNVLHEACKNAKLEMCEHLIKTHPNLLHSVDNNGWNAALHTALGGNVKILQLLADNEVDVKHKDNYGWNILQMACLNANLEMSRYIVQTYPVLLHSVDNNGWNAALHAARGGNLKILQLLADNEVDVKHKDNYGRNILHAACVHANLEMSRYIIQTYPDLLHSVDKYGWNAALYAVKGGNVKILQLLADNEVDVKHKDNDGRNILHAACVHANLEMSRYIIQTYPDLLHSVNNNGRNAALHAALGGNVKILQLLADNEVDVKHKDNYGWNILQMACLNANLEMSRYIVQTYPVLLHSVDNNGWNAALHAARGGNVKILQLLADNEVDVKHKDNDGRNILHAACVHANLEMSRYIIQTYPDLLHSVDKYGCNAALYAVKGGNVKILQLLADNEVDVKHKDNDGRNILHAACVHANLEMSRYIIQTYPDLLHSVNNDGQNAAFFAALGGNVKILELLADHGVKIKTEN